MIRHILFIAFTDSVSVEKMISVKNSFLQIPTYVDGVLGVEWGRNNSQEGKDAGFTHCVMMTFQDEVARQRYLHHPAHDELKSLFLPVLQDIIVFDYETGVDSLNAILYQMSDKK
ncbi:stress protein [Citrobacter freundii complex sp. CFNIH2]|uniref:Dabb family protein n=1 Tax=Citrobacter freundii complex sp. CFNIH2 TaxID=2066049 RepID=UPI000C86B408|nr:Dabb family protein [Citrobacter freundii complex sp. CFNIH2]AUO67244.1 stress protein [Citrobacter freundii complex sp. CFNIH2]